MAAMADFPVATLSAGQRRRVALATLDLVRRPLWLLDEPLNALDAQGVALLSGMIARHCVAGGMVIAATHQPIEAPDLAPRRLDLEPIASTSAETPE
jgi:heme exporter protein A